MVQVLLKMLESGLKALEKERKELKVLDHY